MAVHRCIPERSQERLRCRAASRISWLRSPSPRTTYGFAAAFSGRFKAAFGREPLRNASLAYDATSLAAGLSARFGAQAFADKTLTTPSGFIGVDGAFRFLANGTNERALAVYQIERGTAAVIDPAPKNFSKAVF